LNELIKSTLEEKKALNLLFSGMWINVKFTVSHFSYWKLESYYSKGGYPSLQFGTN
jgi:hypothetical protein